MNGNNSDIFPGDKYIQRRSSTKARKDKKKKKKQESKSSSSKSSSLSTSNGDITDVTLMETPDYFDDNPLSYAENKYVKQVEPDPEAEDPKEQAHLLLSSNEADPDDLLAGGGFHDEFEDELQEIEDKRRNFGAFGESSNPKKYGRCRIYRVPIVIAVLFCVGLVATILYVVGFGKTKSKSAHILMAVPPAPTTLNVTCEQADGSDVQSSVPPSCVQACEKAECCWNPKGPYVCSDDTKEQCQAYQAPCATLARLGQNFEYVDGKEEMVVFPMDTSLNYSCARKAFEVPTACRQGCAKASCCWSTDSNYTCTDDTVHYCGDYKQACGFLNQVVTEDGSNGNGNNGAPFPTAPSGLDVYCNPSEMEQISLHICQDKCSQASCCFDTGVISCQDRYPDACHPYSVACGILNELAVAPGNSKDITATNTDNSGTSTSSINVPAAPSDFATACSKDAILNANDHGATLVQCEEYCLSAECCWAPNVQSCASNSVCDQYQVNCQVFVTLFQAPATSPATSPPTSPPTNKPTQAPTNAPTKPVLDNVPIASEDLNWFCKKDVLNSTVESGEFIGECSGFHGFRTEIQWMMFFSLRQN